MGKKKIKVVDLSSTTPSEKKHHKTAKPAASSTKIDSKLSDNKKALTSEAKEIKKIKAKNNQEIVKTIKKEVEKETKKKKKRPTKTKSKRYKAIKAKIDTNKFYPADHAVDLLLSIANSKIDETVEIHIITRTDKLIGSLNLPHGTGKQQKVAIADEKLIDQISNGKIDFDILIATPQIMAKLAQVARILGPKGLMPNPKAGTITDKPEELKTKLEAGETKYKTENKTPLLHLTLGKISFGKDKLLENLKTLITTVALRNIKKATLTSTQSPGIKLDLDSF